MNNYKINNKPKNYGLIEKQYFYKKEDSKKYDLSNIKDFNKNKNGLISNIHNNDDNIKPFNMNNHKDIKTYNTNNIYNNHQNNNFENLKNKKVYKSVPPKNYQIKESIFEPKIYNKIMKDNNFQDIFLFNNKKEDIFDNKNKLININPEKNMILSSHKNNNKNKNNKKNSFLSTLLDFNNPNKTNLINLEKITSDYKKNSYEAKHIKIKIASLTKEIQINKLKINLIFFYEDFSDENIDLYNRLKLDVLGGYFGIRRIDIFKKLLEEIKKDESGASFILISIGSSFKKIAEICKYFDCIKYIIIFCMKVNMYGDEYGTYLKIKLITDNQNEIYDYLKCISDNEPDYDKNLKNLLNHNLLISFYEYENYYYIHHKMLSFFFKKNFSELGFCNDYMKKVFNFIEHNTDLNKNRKNELKEIIENLKDSENFLNDILKFYTSESKYIYLFNKTMRNMEVGMERLSFLIGPMYYNLVRYLMNENQDLIFNERKTLYRNIYINQYDLESYYMAEGKIICFPSFTSTSFKKGFEPTYNALKINNLYNEKILLKMELSYSPEFNNIPQGMILEDFSSNKNEEEVLLFPFTFIKVKSIKNENNYFKLKGKIINKDRIIEFELKEGKKVVLKNEILTIE